jgi:hypothetical protein
LPKTVPCQECPIILMISESGSTAEPDPAEQVPRQGGEHGDGADERPAAAHGGYRQDQHQ